MVAVTWAGATVRLALKRGERALAAVLPPLMFCAVQDLVRPVLDRRLTHDGRKVRRLDSVFEIVWSSGERFVFPHHRRYSRYMRREGLRHPLNEMLTKYQDGPVRIEPGDTVFEIGANVGEFTIAAASVAARVFSAEPDPQAWKCLVQNTAGKTNIFLDQKAIGETDGSATLHVSSASADSTLLNQKSGGRTAEVGVWTFATWLKAREVETVDFLKLEAEGYEPEILTAAGEALAKVRKIAVDCGPERYGQPTLDECEAILKPHFKTWRRGWVLFGLRN